MFVQRKNPPEWYIAAVHFLIAAFFVPFALVLVIGFCMGLLGVESNAIAGKLISIVAYGIGALSGAWFVKKFYVIPSALQVLNLATVYISLLFIAYVLVGFLNGESTTTALLDFVGFIIDGSVFYFVSKKYIN